MTRFVSLWNRLRGASRREREAAELEEELRFHREMLERDAERAGLAGPSARFAAQRQFGNQTYIREESTDMWRIQPIETLLQDARYAVRFLRRSPVFTIVAVISLALGIGANSAVFTLINAVMMKALPVEDPGSLVMLEPARGRENIQPVFPHPYFRTLEAANTTLDGMFAVSRESNVSIDRGNGAEALPNGAALVSGKYFSTLRVRPAMGRLLGPADDVTRQGHPVVVLSHELWQRAFGGDEQIVGKSIRVNGVSMTIVGVAAEGFHGTQVGERIDLYLPLLMAHVPHRSTEAGVLDERGDWWLYVMGRVKPGVTREQVATELSHLFKRDLLANPPFDRTNVKGMAELADARVMVSDGRSGFAALRLRFAKPLVVLSGMAAIVLLIACTNLASLLSARAAARKKEIAIRLSMGAARWRLLRQLLTESLVLSLGGAVGGALVAYAGARGLVAIASRGRAPVLLTASPDWRVIAFTVAVAVGTAFLFGIVPALQATKLELAPSLRSGGALRGRGAIRFGKVLIATQVALSVLLVFGGSLFVRSLQRMYATDVGFNHAGVIVFRMDPRRVGYRGSALASFYSRAMDQIRAVPGVTAVTSSSHTPFTGAQSGFGGSVEGYTPPPGELADVTRVITAEGYFEMMDIPLKAGRQLGAGDRVGGGGPRFAVVNETFVRSYVPSGQPLGKRIYYGNQDTVGMTIVGVVADAKFRSFRDAPPPIAYWTFTADTTFRGPAQSIFVRIDPKIPNVIPAVRSAIASVDRNVEILLTRSLDEQIAGSVNNERLVATLAAFFGVFALVLAMVGLYGLMAYAVTSRAREIGIRMALGARSDRVARGVMVEALGLVAVGLVVGVPAALAASRVGQALLYGMTPGDWPTMLITAGLLTVVAAIAASIPAWRASRIDPVGMLRAE